MRCVVVQTAFLGDVVLTLPLLALLREIPAVERVVFVAAPAGAELVRWQGAADRVLVYDKRGRDRGFRGFMSLVRRLRDERPDVALIPHRSARSVLGPLFAGIPRRIGFDESGGRLFLTARLPYRRRPHEAERVAELVEAVGGRLPEGRVPFTVVLRQDDAARASSILASRGVDDAVPVVAVAPGSRWPTKRWPSARFADAASEIARATGSVVVVLGDAGDREITDDVAGRLGEQAIDLTGELSVREWAAVIGRAELLLSNDSAAAHVAAGVGTPVVAVFGPTVPAQGFGPYTDRARIVGAGLDCRPCGRHGGYKCPLGTHACMKSIEPSVVAEAALGLLAEASS